jgi:hypothetical protein
VNFGAIGLATSVGRVGYNDERARFRSSLSPLSIDEAPPSSYPRADTRFRLTFQRCR